MFKLFVPWLWPWESAETEPQPLGRVEWNQEKIKFEIGYEPPAESPRDKVQRLAPAFGDLKRLVL